MCRSATLCSLATGYSSLCDLWNLCSISLLVVRMDIYDSATPGSTLECYRVHLIAHSEEDVNNGLQVHRLPSTNNMHRLG